MKAADPLVRLDRSAAARAKVAATGSAAARHAVLTNRRVGGSNVRVGAIIKADLKRGTKATFFSPGSRRGVTCRFSSFTDRVTKNPFRRGTARLRLTSERFRGCTVSGITGARGVRSVSVERLPYNTTTSDSRGKPVTIFRTRTKITLSTILGAIVCTYFKGAVRGHASNIGQVNAFSNQTFNLVSGSGACPAKGDFSATYGPLRNFSVRGHPHIFVN